MKGETSDETRLSFMHSIHQVNTSVLTLFNNTVGGFPAFWAVVDPHPHIVHEA